MNKNFQDKLNRRPNIIYILADDMGYGDVCCNNSASKIPTPNLDKLACNGMRFTDAHSSSSVCSPSRYSILTGRYCWRTPLKRSVLWPWDPPLIDDNRTTVADMLRKHGYRTTCIGKWHLGLEWETKDGKPANGGLRPGEFNRELRIALEDNIDYSKPFRGGPVDRGFDDYFGVDVPNFPPYTWIEKDKLTDLPTDYKPEDMFGTPGRMKPGWKHEAMIPEFVRRAEKYIEDSGNDPFFMYFPLTSPHTPISPNTEFIGMSGAGIYGDFVCEVDWVVGRIMQALESKGISDNTLIIFTSDNGPECAEAAGGGAYNIARSYKHYSMAHLRGVKRDTWEGGHRVPFIASWPAMIPGGAVCNQLVSLGDFFSTAADLINIPFRGEDSISFLPLLMGNLNTAVRESIIHHSCKGMFAVRKDNWVLIDAPSGDDNIEPDWFKKERGYVIHSEDCELFNLKEDISERRNLCREKPEIVEELSVLLREVKTHGENINGACLPGERFSE